MDWFVTPVRVPDPQFFANFPSNVVDDANPLVCTQYLISLPRQSIV